MAHHLPRKKYLSKLLSDSPEDKYSQTSISLNTDSSSCDKLAPNESTESLLTAIANSTRLGISSEFGSAVFTIDTNGNCSGTELVSSDKVKDLTKCREGPGGSTRVESQLQRGSTDDDDKTIESESSPVYFDDGSMDDDDDDIDNGMTTGADLMDDDATCSSQLQSTEMISIDMIPQSSIPLTSSSDELTIPVSVSMSNLIDDDVLNTLLPSAESFANLLSSLESKDKAPMTNGKNYDLLPQQQQHSEAQLNVSCLDAQTNGSVSSRHAYGTAKPASSSSFEHIYVKEEQIDSSYDQQKPAETLTTTSGRNRGRGKASEPKYDCQICGDVAAGYHCGAYVCEACKVSCVTLL